MERSKQKRISERSTISIHNTRHKLKPLTNTKEFRNRLRGNLLLEGLNGAGIEEPLDPVAIGFVFMETLEEVMNESHNESGKKAA